MFRPDEVIPFKLGKEAAKSALQAHLKGKWLLPKFFKEDSRIDKLLGVYVPFWLFDCHADARIQYRATRTHAWSDPHYNYLKTDYFQIIREGGLSFARIPVDGSAKMENAYMEAIEPFDYGQAVGFQTAYLSGYLADKYDVDAHSSQGRANERVKKSTEAVFANTVTGYATCVPERTDLQISQGSVRYALLPVWMLNVQYKGKTYIFAMNGQTGKLAGELPVSWGRFWACFFGIFAGTAMALSAIAAFVGL
jgi:hypothetical protein